jgi:hypothetical protein
MAQTLVDFEDIYTAICEELKVPLTDGVTLARIKRDINMIYLDHIIPFKPRSWWWLELEQTLQTVVKVTTGTVTITNNTATLTFSSAPTVSCAGYFVKINGHQEIAKISAHTASTTSATLTSTWKNGTVTAQTFTAWIDNAEISTSMKEIIQITHDKRSVPLDSTSRSKFQEIRARNPALEGYPTIYNVGDFGSGGGRTLRWFPAASENVTSMHILGVTEATALDADGDEPMMPVEDRISIFYGACSRAWARERNESEATKNWNLFMQKLTSMAGKSQDAPQVTSIQVDRDHLVQTRYKRFFRQRRGRGWRSD